jgi:Flp pilus assembly protein TadG
LSEFYQGQFTTCLAAASEMRPQPATQPSVTTMLGASIIRHIREAGRRFLGANDGNIAVIFTIAAIPVIGFVGAAIDYSRVNSARTSMQAAMDSAALMLSKDLSSGTIQASDIPTKAPLYFAALYTNPNGTVPPISAIYTVNNGKLGNTIQLTGTGSVTTDFMKVLSSSLSTMNFTITSTTAWGNAKMRVALVLDNTGSMADNGKLTALKNAVAGTGGLIDQLSALVQNNGDVYISVIPFAKVVNAGISNSSASWIDWTDWLNPPTSQPNNGGFEATFPPNWHAVGPGATCPFSNSSGGFTCTSSPVNGSSSASTIPSSGTDKGYICPSVDANSHSLYNGCWDSEATGSSGVFCSGSSSCSCTGITSCTCTGTGTGRSCTAPLYVHNWTQPSVVAPVGYPNNKWTPTATPTVLNNWTGASTNSTSTWTGCITDRTQSYDETGDAPVTGNTATLFPANQYYENSTAYCSSSASTTLETVIPLTFNWSTLKTNVNAMQPTGGTDQSVGLAWGWQSLLQTGPIPAPAEAPNTTYNRVIIILSDGLNTEDRWPAYGNGSTENGTDIDTRQAQQCANIKAAVDANGNPMYTLYAIQVDTSSPPDPTSTVLQNCASDPTKFFMLTSSTQIATTFTTIGTALSQLRVAR